MRRLRRPGWARFVYKHGSGVAVSETSEVVDADVEAEVSCGVNPMRGDDGGELPDCLFGLVSICSPALCIYTLSTYKLVRPPVKAACVHSGIPSCERSLPTYRIICQWQRVLTQPWTAHLEASWPMVRFTFAVPLQHPPALTGSPWQ
jgi:hypothetical protein